MAIPLAQGLSNNYQTVALLEPQINRGYIAEGSGGLARSSRHLSNSFPLPVIRNLLTANKFPIAGFYQHSFPRLDLDGA